MLILSVKKHELIIPSSQKSTLTIFYGIQFLPRRVVGKLGSVVYNYLVFVWHSCSLTSSRASHRTLPLWSKPTMHFMLVVKWSRDGSPNVLSCRYGALSATLVDSWLLLVYVSASGDSLQFPEAGCTLIYVPNVKIILVLLFKRKTVCVGFFMGVQTPKWEKRKKKEDTWLLHCTKSENQK